MCSCLLLSTHLKFSTTRKEKKKLFITRNINEQENFLVSRISHKKHWISAFSYLNLQFLTTFLTNDKRNRNNFDRKQKSLKDTEKHWLKTPNKFQRILIEICVWLYPLCLLSDSTRNANLIWNSFIIERQTFSS